MPRHFIAHQKYGNLKPWLNNIDDSPPANEGDLGGGGSQAAEASVEDLQAQIAQLQSTLANKDGIINKLRPIERKWNAVAAGLSEDRLEELKQADQKLVELQSQQEQAALKLRREIAAEYDPKLQELNKQKSTLEQQLEGKNLEYDIFRAYNANGGIGEHFESFIELSKGNFERNKDGHLQVRDDAGNLIIYKDPDAKAGMESERVATAADFIKMLADGTIAKSKYQFRRLPMLQFAMDSYNKASGPLLPDDTGYNGVKPLGELSQTELGSLIFKI